MHLCYLLVNAFQVKIKRYDNSRPMMHDGQNGRCSHNITLWLKRDWIPLSPSLVQLQVEVLGGTPIETLYGDVPPNGSVFDKKSLNMGPIFGPTIPKHGSIF